MKEVTRSTDDIDELDIRILMLTMKNQYSNIDYYYYCQEKTDLGMRGPEMSKIPTCIMAPTRPLLDRRKCPFYK
jgi:hypothetical protein